MSVVAAFGPAAIGAAKHWVEAMGHGPAAPVWLRPARVLEQLADVGVHPVEPPPISSKPSDRYATPQWIVDLVGAFWRRDGIDLDPFWDPTSTVPARHKFNARRGQNAYTRVWPGRTAYVNGPYSGQFPQHTAAAVRRFLGRAGERGVPRGREAINVCPAAVGSTYWKRDVWPVTNAVAWLGRVAFPAGVDVFDDDGRLVCPAGVAQNGNRTEIAAVYSGRFPHVFAEVLESSGKVVTVIDR